MTTRELWEVEEEMENLLAEKERVEQRLEELVEEKERATASQKEDMKRWYDSSQRVKFLAKDQAFWSSQNRSNPYPQTENENGFCLGAPIKMKGTREKGFVIGHTAHYVFMVYGNIFGPYEDMNVQRLHDDSVWWRKV